MLQEPQESCAHTCTLQHCSMPPGATVQASLGGATVQASLGGVPGIGAGWLRWLAQGEREAREAEAEADAALQPHADGGDVWASVRPLEVGVVPLAKSDEGVAVRAGHGKAGRAY